MYVTITEADDYVSAHYRSNNANRVRWTALSDEDKTILLTNAFEAIESLPFRGRKAVAEQKTAFPRLPYQYGNALEAPTNVKNAQVELALYLSDDTAQQSSEKRSKLIADGVKSFSVGDLSESYGDDKNGSEMLTAQRCKKCMELLKPYLSGGFDIA